MHSRQNFPPSTRITIAAGACTSESKGKDEKDGGGIHCSVEGYNNVKTSVRAGWSVVCGVMDWGFFVHSVRTYVYSFVLS